MIPKEQLRIGNWVLDDGVPVQVTEILRSHVNHTKAEYAPYDELDPIPLSPEVLERLGFTKNGFGEYEILLDDKNYSCVQKKLYFSGDYLYLEEWRDGVTRITINDFYNSFAKENNL